MRHFFFGLVYMHSVLNAEDKKIYPPTLLIKYLSRNISNIFTSLQLSIKQEQKQFFCTITQGTKLFQKNLGH